MSVAAIKLVALPGQPKVDNPIGMEQLIAALQKKRLLSFLGMSPQDFLVTLETEGVRLNPQMRNRIGNKNNTFTIKALGEAGSVQKAITAVVRMDDQGMGRLLYWREE